jgi:hypothetical protein
LEISFAFAPVLSTPPVVPLLLPVLLARGSPTPELEGVVSGAAVMLVNSVVGLAVDVSSDGRAETLDRTEGLAEDVEIDVALTPSDDGSETEVAGADGTKGDEVKPDPTPTPRRG